MASANITSWNGIVGQQCGAARLLHPILWTRQGLRRLRHHRQHWRRYRHGCSARFGYHAHEGSPRPVGWAEMQGLVRGGRRRRPFPHDGVSYGGTRASELGVEAVGILSSIASYLFALRDSTWEIENHVFIILVAYSWEHTKYVSSEVKVQVYVLWSMHFLIVFVVGTLICFQAPLRVLFGLRKMNLLSWEEQHCTEPHWYSKNNWELYLMTRSKASLRSFCKPTEIQIGGLKFSKLEINLLKILVTLEGFFIFFEVSSYWSHNCLFLSVWCLWSLFIEL